MAEIKTFSKSRQRDTYTHAHIPHRDSIMADRILLREKGFPDTRHVYIIIEIGFAHESEMKEGVIPGCFEHHFGIVERL